MGSSRVPARPISQESTASTALLDPIAMTTHIQNYEDQEKNTHTSMDSPKLIEANVLPSTNEFPVTSGEILRFIPNNLQAQQAFHELACKTLNGHLDSHHAQFIKIQGKGLLADREGYDQVSSSEVASAESQDETQREQKEIHMGYFAVNFKNSAVAMGGKWAIGKGLSKGHPNRNVDVLLAAPDSSHRKQLAPAHAFLHMNVSSGAWMIGAGSVCRHVLSDAEGFECSHAPVLLDDEIIRHGKYSCISRAHMPFVVGGLRYLIQFTIKDVDSENSYLLDRAVWLKKNGLKGPAALTSGIPFDSDIRSDHAVFRRGLGSGTFGTVFEGFDPNLGDVRAIKKMTVKSKATVPEIKSEVEVHEAIPKATGIVQFYGYSNSLGQATFGPSYPFEIYVTMEKGSSFMDTFVTESLIIDQSRQKVLCKQLLKGLATVHELGWMHRDINVKNILYFGGEPEHAGLCDFGKLCRTKADTATTIAAWCWLPPEIQKYGKEAYNQKIDIWMLGYALIFSWYRGNVGQANLRDSRDHRMVMQSLSKSRDPFLLLFANMLSWDPACRPSAQEALDDISLREISLQEEPDIPESSKRRAPP